MRKIVRIATLAGALLLGGCAGFGRTLPAPGEPVEVVRQKMGQPTSVYPGVGDDAQVLEYATGPMGQFTWMAHIGQDGRLRRVEQVLTGEGFAAIQVGRSTKQDVLRTIGRPAETSRVAFGNYEVWSYRYKENGVWNSMMHVHFDQSGVVRQMLNAPDRMFEDRRFGD
jgi:hypothetical protein